MSWEQLRTYINLITNIFQKTKNKQLTRFLGMTELGMDETS